MYYIGVDLGSPKITLYLPEAEYRALSVRGNTGNVEIPEGFAFGSVEISLSTGDAAFFASAADTVKIRTGTGNIRAEHGAAGALELSVTTGAVTAAEVRCAGGRCKITTGAGDIRITIENKKRSPSG